MLSQEPTSQLPADWDYVRGTERRTSATVSYGSGAGVRHAKLIGGYLADSGRTLRLTVLANWAKICWVSKPRFKLSDTLEGISLVW